jgi:hypothetical protein
MGGTNCQYTDREPAKSGDSRIDVEGAPEFLRHLTESTTMEVLWDP